MRILHILAGGEFGGAEAQVLAMCKGLMARAIPARLAVFYEAQFAQKAREAGVDVVLLKGGDPFRDTLAVQADARVWRPSIVHTHGVRASVAGRWAGKRLGVPVVTSVHSDLYYDYASPLKRSLFMALEALTRGISARVIAASSALYQVLRDRGYPAEQLSIIENGMDIAGAEQQLDLARTHLADIRASLHIPADALVVVCVARLHPVKRHDVLIDAVAILPEQIQGRTVHLLLVGDGVMKDALAARISQHGESFARRVHLLGAREDVMAILCSATLFALTSQMEGLPISVLEAMLAGLPVVASKVGGLVDVVQADAGLLVPVGNPQTLAQGLERILSDERLCRQMGDKGRERARSRYTQERMNEEIEALYRSVEPLTTASRAKSV